MKATKLYRKHNEENSVTSPGKVTAIEFLQQKVPIFIEPSVWPLNSPDINPSIMLSGVLCSKMCTEFRSWVWRISKTERIPGGPVSINN